MERYTFAKKLAGGNAHLANKLNLNWKDLGPLTVHVLPQLTKQKSLRNILI